MNRNKNLEQLSSQILRKTGQELYPLKNTLKFSLIIIPSILSLMPLNKNGFNRTPEESEELDNYWRKTLTPNIDESSTRIIGQQPVLSNFDENNYQPELIVDKVKTKRKEKKASKIRKPSMPHCEKCGEKHPRYEDC